MIFGKVLSRAGRAAVAAAAALLLALPAAAQMPERAFVFALDALAAVQGATDLAGGGSFSATRLYLQAGGLRQFDGGSIGLFASTGRIAYDFAGLAAPWGDVTDIGISLPLRLGFGDAEVLVAPTLRFDHEDGADRDDGQTAGAFLGVAWTFSDELTLGPAFGVFSELGSNDLTVFPAILVDWQITDRARLTTGPTIGATQGPGLAFDYALTEDLRLGIAGRREAIRFRLDDEGPAPGGIGEDTSFPLVLTLDYTPAPGSRIAAFAGAEFGGELRLEDAAGRLVEVRDYDPAPIFGIALRIAF